MTILAAGMKSLLNTSIFYAYGGQILAGLAQPIILNSPGKIASTWFRDERVKFRIIEIESDRHFDLLCFEYDRNNFRVHPPHFFC